jgi:uncharacterized protein (DUF1778 family)
MKDLTEIRSRRQRAATPKKANTPMFVYVDADERELIQRAARTMRHSDSGFIADAALDKAIDVLGIAGDRRIFLQGKRRLAKVDEGIDK